jgi:hypothetical protein
LFDQPKKLDPVHFRHLDVGDDQIDFLGPNRFGGLGRSLKGDYVMPLGGQKRRKRVAHAALVVNYHDPGVIFRHGASV